MTDKEPIKWDDETKWAYEKCKQVEEPKEPIIIDGVDITGCVNCLRFCMTTKKPEAICKIYEYCSKKPDCYFKQLARKTQECEKLSILAQEESARNAYIEYELNDKLKQKTQECEQLKEDFQKQVEDMLEWQKTVVSLFDKTCRCSSLDEKTAICKENGKECISIVGCRDRYRKALAEIEEYIYNNTDFDINDSIQSKTAGYDILQIIKDV